MSRGPWRAPCVVSSTRPRASTVVGHRQLPDGSWFNYYLGDGVKDQRLDTNVCAYLAAGAWHHHLITGDVEFLGELWPTIEGGIDFILRYQQPEGPRLLETGRPARAVRPPDRVVVHLRLAAMRGGRGRDAGHPPLPVAQRVAVLRPRPITPRPSHPRSSSPWTRAIPRRSRRPRPRKGRLRPPKWSTFVMEGLEVRWRPPTTGATAAYNG